MLAKQAHSSLSKRIDLIFPLQLSQTRTPCFATHHQQFKVLGFHRPSSMKSHSKII